MTRTRSLAAVMGAALLASVPAGVFAQDQDLVVTCDAPSEGGGGLAMSFGGGDIVLWNDILTFMQPAVEACGYRFLIDDPQWEVDQQVNDWRTWIAQGDVKAIMGFPIQPEALVPVTEEANQEGVVILGYTQHWGGENGETAAALVSDPPVEGKVLGAESGAWIAEHYGDEAVKVAVMGDREFDTSRRRIEGIIEGIQEQAPNAEIFELFGISRDDGYNSAQSHLTAHPDTRVWVATAEDSAKGIYQALLDSGVAADDPDYFLGNIDLTNEALQIIGQPDSIWRVGYVFTAKELAKANASLLIDAAHLLEEGRTVEEINDTLEDYIISPLRVTADNWEDFLVAEQ